MAHGRVCVSVTAHEYVFVPFSSLLKEYNMFVCVYMCVCVCACVCVCVCAVTLNVAKASEAISKVENSTYWKKR